MIESEKEEDENQEEEEKEMNRFKWARNRLEEVKQVLSQVFASVAKGVSATIERDYTWLRVNIYLPDEQGSIAFEVTFSRNGMEIDNYTILLDDFVAMYSRNSKFVYVKDNYADYFANGIEPPSAIWVNSEKFGRNIAVSLGYHALTYARVPDHIACEHLFKLAEIDKTLFSPKS